jgi:hypothetical protein
MLPTKAVIWKQKVIPRCLFSSLVRGTYSAKTVTLWRFPNVLGISNGSWKEQSPSTAEDHLWPQSTAGSSEHTKTLQCGAKGGPLKYLISLSNVDRCLSASPSTSVTLKTAKLKHLLKMQLWLSTLQLNF